MFAAYYCSGFGWASLAKKEGKYVASFNRGEHTLTVWSTEELAEEVISGGKICFVARAADLTKKELNACLLIGALSRGSPVRAKPIQARELDARSVVLIVVPTSVYSEELLAKRLVEAERFGVNIKYAVEDLLGEYL